jgi:ZIP family zinc transporter
MIGIQIISSFLHDHIPSHAVNCDHIHEDTAHDHGHRHARKESPGTDAVRALEAANGDATEATALLPGNREARKPVLPNGDTIPEEHDGASQTRPHRDPDHPQRRPSITQVPKRILSFVRGTKANCDEEGPCHGYSDPCGRDCFKHLGTKLSVQRSSDPCAQRPCSHASSHPSRAAPNGSYETNTHRRAVVGAHLEPTDEVIESDEDDFEIHHHHVPENAFMSLGLQTSIAIALHKLPEGFITYATNHANPSLGFSVFTALFIHNITEGFSLALPLFLALHSRTKALLWSFLLGSVSQPLGAAIAMSWFKIAGRDGQVPGEGVYGCMFAVTAGIMTSVALTLFLEAISLNHNRNLCIAFGFTGMVMMGMSNALKA